MSLSKRSFEFAEAELCRLLDEMVYAPVAAELGRAGVSHSLGVRKEKFKGEIERVLKRLVEEA